jgi:T5SS/PEP-CTERM-associated repeat protein
MATYQWTGDAGIGDFGTPANWLVIGGANPAASSPGPTDGAISTGPTMTITGSGVVQTLTLAGTVRIAAALDASVGIDSTSGTRIDGATTLLPAAELTTLLLDIGSSANSTGKLTVGQHSRVVIAGSHPANNYAVSLGTKTGSVGVLLVHGPGAVVSGGNLPLAVGLNGNGLLRIDDGGLVTVGNLDPAINFAAVIGNHAGSSGKIEIEEASLLTDGAYFVGRSAPGTLDIGLGGLVAGGNMFVGANAGGVGLVSVHGNAARLVLTNTLQVGAKGSGTLTIAESGMVSVGGSVAVEGSVTLDGGSMVASSMAVATSAVVSGAGGISIAGGISNSGTMAAGQSLTITAPVVNNGTISTHTGGHLELIGSVTGTGTITLAENSHLSLQATSANQTVIFAGTGATLQLRCPNSFGATVQGFGKSDAIALDLVATGLSFAGGVISLNGPAGTVAQIKLAGAYSIANLHLTTTANGESVVNFHP